MASSGDLATLMGEAARSKDGAVLARVVQLTGFGGSTRVGQGAVIFADRWFGSFLGDTPHEKVLTQGREMLDGASHARCLDVVIGDEEAVAARLACGGTATVVLTPLHELQGSLNDVLQRRIPYAVVTVVVKTDRSVRFQGVLDPEDGLTPEIRAAIQSEQLNLEVDAHIRKGRPGLFRLEDDEVTIYGEIVTPMSRVVILGSGDLADAIAELGSGLGMEVETLATKDQGVALVGGLGPLDGLVVLSHDHDLATPVVAELLRRSPRTYVGSLGSRHTQHERRRRLEVEGLSLDDLRGLYGPAGLDLGSRTVEETAVAIIAELLAHRSGRSGGHLRDSVGPING